MRGTALSPAEHYREAEALLAKSQTVDSEYAMLVVAQAEVHAILATVPHNNLPRGTERSEW